MQARISPISYFGQREAIIADLWTIIGNRKFRRMHDLCGGSGSISFAAMRDSKADSYVYNDSFPMFMHLWNAIQDNPRQLSNEYNALLNEFRADTQHREAFYLDILAKFNCPAPDNTLTQRARALQFAFLINFSNDHMPLFNQQKQLVTTPRQNITDTEIDEQSRNFRNRSDELFALLADNDFRATSGDFNTHLEHATDEDIVILDPPYPQQTRDIYFNINTEDELFANLTASLKKLADRKVPAIILYGANAVLLNNQFPVADLDLHHLVRLANHPLFGDYLEHVYISQVLFPDLKKLPPHIMPYERLFKPAEEMTTKACGLVVQQLKAAVAAAEVTHAQVRFNHFQPRPAATSSSTLMTARPQYTL